MSRKERTSTRLRWARLRFSIIGPLFASPPARGELEQKFEELSQKTWRHPSKNKPVKFAFSTIERWYYLALNEDDPLSALMRKIHAHQGMHPKISSALAAAIKASYSEHPSWSYQLHYDNLQELAKAHPEWEGFPSYSTVHRYMLHRGMVRRRRTKHRKNETATMFQVREKRLFEVAHVNALWHYDFHEGSRNVLTPDGWQKPKLLGVLDDHSRLACHLQWYLNETSETLVHGFSQALQKRGLPRAGLSDCGSAMVSAEFSEGLERLGILQHTTLPYTPEQNAKQECFWAQVEGRLMAMLEGENELTLALLNEATQAWVELEYNRKYHSEIKESPIERYLRDMNVSRPCPSSEKLRQAFRTEMTRRQRLSDGTITVDGVRFEVPSVYRALLNLKVRVARWDLSSVDLVDPHTGQFLTKLYPVDKLKNSDGIRRSMTVDDDDQESPSSVQSSGIAPLLRSMMETHAATGLPPAYLPKQDKASSQDGQED